MYVRLAPEPRHLPLGVIAMALLRLRDRFLQGDFLAQVLRSLLVSQRLQRQCRPVIALQQSSGFFHQPTFKHLLPPLINALVEGLAARIQSHTKNAESLERVASLLPQLGHALARTDADL